MGSMGLQTAFGNDALFQLLSRRKAEALAAQHYQDQQQQQQVENDLKLRQLDQNDALRHDAQAETRRQNNLVDEDRNMGTANVLAEQMQPGPYRANDPMVGALRSGKRGGLVPDQGIQMPAAPDSLAMGPQGGEMPGTVMNSPSPGDRMVNKQPTATQQNVMDDNTRLDAAAANGAGGPQGLQRARAQSAVAMLKHLQAVHTSLQQGEGPGQLYKGATENVKGYLNLQNDATEYQALRKATAVAIAVAIQGSRPSDADADAMAALLPDFKTPQGVASNLFDATLKQLDATGAAMGGGRQPAADETNPFQPMSSHQPTDAHPPMDKNGWRYEWKGDRYTPVSPVSASRPNVATPAPARPTVAAPRAPLDSNQYPLMGTLPADPAGAQPTAGPLASRPSAGIGRLQTGAPRQLGNTISPQGSAALQAREGFSATPYPDVNGLAVGYGMHTWDGKPVTPELRVDRPQANTEMTRQIRETYGRIVDRALQVPVSQGQYDALVSLAWNLPAAAKHVIGKLNRGEPITAQDFQISATVKGHQDTGLVKRRTSEYSTFSGGE